MNFIALWFLFVAHHLGDMVFQTSFIAQYKRDKIFVMLFHAIIWAGVVSIPLYLFGMFTYWKIAWLVFGHAAIDTWKVRQPRDEKHFWCIYVDQILHWVQLSVVWLL